MISSSEKTLSFCVSTLGVLVVTVLKMLTRTRKRVTRRAIRPGITSIGIRNEIHDTITNRPVYHEQEKYCKCLKYIIS